MDMRAVHLIYMVKVALEFSSFAEEMSHRASIQQGDRKSFGERWKYQDR